MGSSESGGVRDGGAGSIVWVRRRNGSWWPGKILGPDELSASHLMSPRSGTPVKLLGREDASVDWYNLEKSKRVKAFRCGEFDDCIERAEASLGLPAKKREKYARREDAILHALELEKQFFERKYGKSGSTHLIREKPFDSERKDLIRSSGGLENGNGKLVNHELRQLGRTVDISNLMERKGVSMYTHKAIDGTHPSLEESGTDLSFQVRGLHGFGLKEVATPRTIYNSVVPEESKKMAVDGHVYAAPTTDPCFENSSDSDSRNSLGKRKRSLECLIEEPVPKKRDRLHSFVKVRQNNAKSHASFLHPDVHRKEIPVDGIHRSMYFPSESHEIFVTKQGGQMETPLSQLDMGNFRSKRGTSVEETTSGSSEETESDSSETHSLEAHVEAGAMLSDADTCIRTQPRMLDRLQMQAGHESTSGDESDELSLDERSQFYFHDPSPASGVSKWQLKGKRNVRHINKRPVVDNRFTSGSYLETGGSSSMSHRAPPNHGLSYYHDNGYTNDTDNMDEDFDPHSQGLSKRGYLPSQAAARRHNFIGQNNMINWDEFTWGRQLRGFWEERGGCFDPMFGGRNGHDLLIDVDLKVQANRKGGEHVPWVSLMSRLNGKAIIGHPIQIETLEDGSTDILVSTSDDVFGDVRYDDSDRSKAAPPVWRTAKRTANFRVPRPHPSSSSQLDGDEEDSDDQYIHQLRKVRSKKSLPSNSVRKGGIMTKKTKFPFQGMKKLTRKVNMSSNQKTKALSSIGIDQKFPVKKKEEDTSSCQIDDGVMKSGNSDPQKMACIPVKLAFSRLLESVGRPPSAPPNKERNPA
ncbi:hypothetical protein SOVF_005550 [Spinacia oleracea]|uniref:Uncharacterized protein At1g51745 n=1 Tax=Spinacia oleracea TaxID=3562 RepID=A0A9R0IBM9_SPIOL|nr:uncharacterized protein At1g51745 [Spinacia oleracea]KNA25560.1 hypothetical protein SOVF_005550 [Spinacia oleracea]